MSVDPSKALRCSCERCGAVLRHGHSGRRCDPCSGQLDVAEQLREAGFFSREPVRRALAGGDFGYLFRAVRRATGLTQIELGEILGMGQERISRIECGEHRLRDFDTVVRVAARLGIPAELLGFRANTTSVENAAIDEESSEVDGVLRRTFSGSAIGIVLGLGLGTLDLDRLARLLPADPADSVGRIGTADVAEIEHTTDLLRRMDMSRGGESCHRGAVQQLRSVLPLLRRESTSEVRDRLLVATADLGKVAAWASYDAGRHAEARRLFLLALEVVQHAEHPSATDLTALLLILMTNQAIQLGQPRDGLSLIQLGYSIAGRRTQPLSPSRASELACYQGWCQAAQGDVRGCDRALGQAIEHLTHADLTTATPWSWCLTTAELTARHGHAYYTLAQTTPGSPGALLHRSPLRTVRATRRGIRLKQAAWAI